MIAFGKALDEVFSKKSEVEGIKRYCEARGAVNYHLDYGNYGCDMIFVPQGTPHNVINLNHKPLKLISVYSANDIPANSVYLTKADTL